MGCGLVVPTDSVFLFVFKVSKPLEKKTTQGFETILEPFRIGLYIRNKDFFLIIYI